MKKHYLTRFCLLFLVFSSGLSMISCQSGSGAEVNIIPLPKEVKLQGGTFLLSDETAIVSTDPELLGMLTAIQQEFIKRYQAMLPIIDGSAMPKRTIHLETDVNLGAETYRLEITSGKITCHAASSAGFFYGLQSLIQLVEKQEDGKLSIPCGTIQDEPAYPWRGFMLDDSRHFFGKETVKQYLDVMASLKLNRFHWHLTDEPAWRIEIKKYPLLTEIGAIGVWDDKNAPRAFYTQEDIREIVAYAADRQIMVIPEIDMPGHATAAARAYPKISGGGEGRWKDFTFHPAKEYTYEFIDNIMTEIAGLFPAPYIHIGGDEVHYGNQSWFTDPVIQRFIKENNLENEVGMEHYFVRRVCDIVNSKGKMMLGWDEMTEAGVSPDKTLVMWWRHDKPEVLSAALEKGYQIVLTPRIPCYFDFVQDSTHQVGRRWGGKFCDLSTVYHFPENLDSLTSVGKTQVLGLQANLWTERIADKKRLDFMTFPRLLAIAEDGWTEPAQKDYAGFMKRVECFVQYLRTLGINCFNIFDPTASPEPTGPTKADVLSEG